MTHEIDLFDPFKGQQRLKVFGALSYASGDRLIFTDAPWLLRDPSPLRNYADTVFSFREVQGRWLSVWGFPEKVFDWASAARIGDTVKLSNRRFTKLDPSGLPSSITVHNDDVAPW